MIRMLVPGVLLAMLPVGTAQHQTKPTGSADPAVHTLCSGDGAAPTVPTLLPGYGDGGFTIRTDDPKAQAFFDNGMQLGHAFAHKASIGAFAEAARIDPTCAMCLWGDAWASGPTINYPIDPATMVKLAAMNATAERLSAGAPVKEREMIAALKLRYNKGGGSGAGDKAFAKAMDVLAERYPDDDEIVTLAADAEMVPVALGNKSSNVPHPVALLERVLKRNPTYTPAIHFYIHATEMSGFPQRAEPYADKLATLAPNASHLIHMPSHTYFWIGRYQDAVDANVRAVAIGIANAKRLGLAEPDGVWDLPYHGHNVQFGVGGALMSGDGKDALALSSPLVRIAAIKDKAPAYIQIAAGTAYFAEGRFAAPEAVMALAEPKLPYLKAYWHYARGEAKARMGDAAGVRAEAAMIPARAGAASDEDGSATAARMTAIARLVLEGRAAMMEQHPALALAAFTKAAKLQEAKKFAAFSDPPAWWYPVRRDVAAALLAMGKPAEAIRQADATLAAHPRDPVTLAYRAQAEAAMGDHAKAAADKVAALRDWHGDRRMLPRIS